MTLRFPADEYLYDRLKPVPAFLGGEVVITIASRAKWDGTRWIYEFFPVEAGVVEETQRSEAA